MSNSVCRNQKQFPWVSGTWAELYRQSVMRVWNTRHTSQGLCCWWTFFLETSCPSYWPLSSFRFLRSLSKDAFKLQPFPPFIPSAPLQPCLHLCFCPAVKHLLLCDVWCLLHAAMWGQGFCPCVHCCIHCALNGVWHKVRLRISCTYNELMADWTQKLRRVEKGILGWGNVLEKSQRWGSEKNVMGYWDVGIKAGESHLATTLVEGLEGWAGDLTLWRSNETFKRIWMTPGF